MDYIEGIRCTRCSKQGMTQTWLLPKTSIEKHVKVRDLLKAIDKQFSKTDKSLASILIIRFSSLRLTEIRGVRDHS